MKSTKRTAQKATKKRTVIEKPEATATIHSKTIKVEKSPSQSVSSSAKTSPKAKMPKATLPEPVKKTSKRPQPSTMVAVKVDVGYGNTLYIRGQGLGLAWDKGLPLNCVDSSTWVWSAKDGKDKVEFKVLINDKVWSKGENLKVTPGERLEIAPAF